MRKAERSLSNKVTSSLACIHGPVTKFTTVKWPIYTLVLARINILRFYSFGTWCGDLGLANYLWYLAERFELRFEWEKSNGHFENRSDENLSWTGVVEWRSRKEIQELYEEVFYYSWRIHKCVSVCQTFCCQIYLASVRPSKKNTCFSSGFL